MAQSLPNKFLEWLKVEFGPGRLVPSLISGVLMSISGLVFTLSVSSLIFGGDLAGYLSHGIRVGLISLVIFLVVTSLISSVPGVIGSTQESPAVVLALVVSLVSGSLTVSSGKDLLTTVMVAIAFTTVVTGVFFLSIGGFKLGKLVRYIPYPVVGGFMAGTGWLLVTASFTVLTDLPVDYSNLSVFLQGTAIIQWMPGVVFGVALFVILKRHQHYLIPALLMLGAVGLFYIALLITGTSFQEAIALGLLIGEVSGEIAWGEMLHFNLAVVDWGILLGQAGSIAVILIISLISLLLNITSLELAIERDIDLDKELRVCGITNLLSGLAGGLIGFHTLSDTLLSYRVSARGRLAGLFAGGFIALMSFAGFNFLVYFPKAVLGGLLLFMGLDFLYDWVVKSWSRLSKVEWSIVVLILLVIASIDFLTGIGVGLVAMLLLFVVSYTQVGAVHHDLSGGEMRSNKERSVNQQNYLFRNGGKIYILELKGYIFFGTANSLLDRLRERINDPKKVPVEFIILDFTRVSGLDSSAVYAFMRARQLAEAEEITLVMTDASEKTLKQLELGGVRRSDQWVICFPDLDRGLEWCENMLLQAREREMTLVPASLRVWLAESGIIGTNIERLLCYLEKVEMEKGEKLIQQGDESDDLYFIERGCVSIYLELDHGERVRLRTMDRGTVVGEIGLYLGTPRTSSVIADECGTAYRLTRKALNEMSQKDPDLAAFVHELIARLLARRLTDTTRLVGALKK